jgi:hydrogenase-4 component B
MTTLSCIGASLELLFAFGVIGIGLSAVTRGKRTMRTFVVFSGLCSFSMMAAAAIALGTGQEFHANLWMIEGIGRLSVRIDMLSAVFLFVAGLVYLPASLFVRNLLEQRFGGRYPLRNYAVMHFALLLSVALILVANDAVTFLIGWECMSILCFLLVNYEQARRADFRAGYLLLAMGEAGFLAVAVAFAILGQNAANWSFPALAAASAHLSQGAAAWIFLLAFFGFGVKAGLVPVNFWLPRSYKAAPAIFLPVLAGITLNLGFYGILRVAGDLIPLHTAWMGLVALVTGSVTALVGILYATTDNDIKTMLAHSSIENAGIIVAATGASLVFRATGDGTAAAIALVAGLYHMANHSVYKALLFQGAGEIEAVTGTRDMDKLGGLACLLPALSVVFLVGCLSISAIPPFNGFVSEWLTLQSLLRSAELASPPVKILFALCGACLALTAALAVTCFVRVYAMSFLGIRRGDWEPRIRQKTTRPQIAMTYLAVACLLLGILPTYVIPALNRAVEPMTGTSASAVLVPSFFTATPTNQQLPPAFLADFHNIGAQTGHSWIPGRGLVVLVRGAARNPVIFAASPAYALIALAIFLLVLWLVVKFFTRERKASRGELWAGGIPRLLPEMSYTATGFSNPVRVVFQAIFRPNLVEDTRETVAVHFRTAILRRREETHLVDRLFFHPVGSAFNWVGKAFAGMHHGRLSAYVAYSLGFFLLILLLFRLH